MLQAEIFEAHRAAYQRLAEVVVDEKSREVLLKAAATMDAHCDLHQAHEEANLARRWGESDEEFRARTGRDPAQYPEPARIRELTAGEAEREARNRNR